MSRYRAEVGQDLLRQGYFRVKKDCLFYSKEELLEKCISKLTDTMLNVAPEAAKELDSAQQRTVHHDAGHESGGQK